MPIKQLRQILMQRISSILQLQTYFNQKCKQNIKVISLKQSSQSESPTINKYDIILQHKKAQRHRSIRQSQLLSNLYNISLISSSLQKQVYCCIIDACALYDHQFKCYKSVQHHSTTLKIKQIFNIFFVKHGFKQKSQYINNLWERDINLITPTLFIGWMSQWSKKIYCQILQKQITSSFHLQDRSPKALQNSFTLAMFSSKRRQSKNINEITYNQLTDISLSTRTNIHSFMLDELTMYYKITGIQNIDYSYLKTIRKRLGKQDLVQSPNISKAVQTIIQTSGNKQISVIIKSYQMDYMNKYPKKLKNQRKKFEQIKKKIITSSPPLLTPINSVSPLKRKQKISTETDDTNNNVQFRQLSPKVSQFQQMKNQDSEIRIKRIKFLNHQKFIKNNIQFPGILHKKQQIKGDIKLIFPQNNQNSVILQVPAIQTKSNKKHESESTLQKRLKDRDFLRCESISSKFNIKNDQNIINEYGQKQKNKISILKSFQNHLINQYNDYDDNRLKISKMLQLADLRKKLNVTSNRMLLQQAQ